jgi:hypothetical protein
MLTRTDEFIRRFEGCVAEEIGRQSDNMASGACQDHGEYKHRAGIIAGLRRASELVAETQRQMAEHDRS